MVPRFREGRLLGKLMKARTSVSASSISPASLGTLGPQLVGHLAPLGAGGLGVLLGEGGADEGGDDAAALLAGMGQEVAHEVHPAALPGGVQDLGDGCLQALMRVRDDQLDAAQTARASLRKNSVQKVSASDGPISIPSISPHGSCPWAEGPRPSLLTAIARITAVESTRPPLRPLT